MAPKIDPTEILTWLADMAEDLATISRPLSDKLTKQFEQAARTARQLTPQLGGSGKA